MAASKQTRLIIGAAVADIESRPVTLRIATFADFGQ